MTIDVRLKWLDTSPDGKSAVLLNEKTGRYVVINKGETFGVSYEEELKNTLMSWARNEIQYCSYGASGTFVSPVELKARIESARTVLKLVGAIMWYE